MTLLVLHVGAEYADGGAIQRDLLAWRAQLGDAGVVLPAGSTETEWKETAQGVLRGKLSPAAGALLTEAKERAARVVLLSSDVLADALTSPDEAATLAGLAAAEGFDLRVVVVVREQIGYINSLYCRRVLRLDTARSFTEFATTSVPAHRFDYVASFGAIADAEGADLVAVPYAELRSDGAGRAVLKAAGLSDEDLAALPPAGAEPTPVPGPVLVGATRLLHKRLRRFQMFDEHGKPRLRPLVDKLAAQAVAGGWDTSEFWGWDSPLRRRVEVEHQESNDMFAEFVWSTPWPEPWSTGKPNRVDLPDLEPAILRDVLTTVERLVAELVRPGVKPAG